MREALTRQSPVKKERQKKAFSKFLIVLIILIALFVGLGLLSHLKSLVINEVEVTGTKIIDKESVKAGVLEFLSGNQALLYARGNIFIFSKDNIVKLIKDEFPRVYEVPMIEREGQKLSISIEERDAAYLWCGAVAPAYVERFLPKDCFFLDQKGFIFDEAPFFTDGVYRVFYGGLSEGETIGQTLNIRNSMEDMKAFAEALEEDGFRTHSIIIGGDGQHSMLLDAKSDTGDFGKILFNEDESLNDTLDKLHTAFKEEAFRSEYDLKKSYLEYIDTRFRNRVFYKFKEI